MRFLKEARNFVIIKMLSQDLIKHIKIQRLRNF